MKPFEQENQTIRRFLLGQLTDEQAEQLEDRIFTQPDFAEEVQIVEGELIADQQAGRLTSEESEIFRTRYKATKANQFNVEYETAFREFVCSKFDSSRAQLEKQQQSLPEKSGGPSPSPQGGFWHRFVFRFGPPAAYATVVLALLFLAAAAWYLISSLRHSSDLATQNRETIEAELAQLNSVGASAGSILSTVDLQIAHRTGGAMARIAFNTTPDKVFEFHLNLAQLSARKYRVLVFDDHRNELFAVSNLIAQNTDNGPQIHLLIPVKYLKPGDYQVDLSVANDTGGLDQVNSYAFRVADTRK